MTTLSVGIIRITIFSLQDRGFRPDADPRLLLRHSGRKVTALLRSGRGAPALTRLGGGEKFLASRGVVLILARCPSREFLVGLRVVGARLDLDRNRSRHHEAEAVPGGALNFAHTVAL